MYPRYLFSAAPTQHIGRCSSLPSPSNTDYSYYAHLGKPFLKLLAVHNVHWAMDVFCEIMIVNVSKGKAGKLNGSLVPTISFSSTTNHRKGPVPKSFSPTHHVFVLFASRVPCQPVTSCQSPCASCHCTIVQTSLLISLSICSTIWAPETCEAGAGTAVVLATFVIHVVFCFI